MATCETPREASGALWETGHFLEMEFRKDI